MCKWFINYTLQIKFLNLNYIPHTTFCNINKESKYIPAKELILLIICEYESKYQQAYSIIWLEENRYVYRGSCPGQRMITLRCCYSWSWTGKGKHYWVHLVMDLWCGNLETVHTTLTRLLCCPCLMEFAISQHVYSTPTPAWYLHPGIMSSQVSG